MKSRKRYKKIFEITIYKKPFWNYLIHRTKSWKDKKSILQNKFILGKNPFILKGIYTQPDVWFKSSISKNTDIKIFTKPNCKIFDNGANRPMDSSRGIGSKEWNKIYCSILNKLGYNIYPTDKDEDWDWYTKNSNTINHLLNNNRKKYMDILYNFLTKQNYDIVVNGGEIIIINPLCIEKIE